MFNYGIVAAKKVDDSEDKFEILHFVGYQEKPNDSELAIVKDNLMTNPEYEMMKDKIIFLHATQELVDYYKNMFEEQQNK